LSLEFREWVWENSLDLAQQSQSFHRTRLHGLRKSSFRCMHREQWPFQK